MLDGRFALARHQQQSLVAVLVATVIAGAVALAAVGPLRTVTDDDAPEPMRLVDTTQRIETEPARTGAQDLQVDARSFDARSGGEGTDQPIDDGATSESAPTNPPVTSPPPTEPPPTEPAPTEPPPTEPSVTEPSVTEPTVTEPPPTEPTVTEPPPTEPFPTVTLPPITFPRPTLTILPPDDDDGDD